MPVDHAFGSPKTCRPDSRIGKTSFVIGAGLAGLSAARLPTFAWRLRHPYSKQEDRPGGRVHSQRLAGGHVIDLGCAVHGRHADLTSRLWADEAGLHRVSAVVPGHILHLSSEDAVPSRRPADQLPLSMIDRFDALQAFWRLVACDGIARRSKSCAARPHRCGLLYSREDFLRPAFQAIGGYLGGRDLHAATAMCRPIEALEQGASIGGFAGEGASAQWFLASRCGNNGRNFWQRANRGLSCPQCAGFPGHAELG